MKNNRRLPSRSLKRLFASVTFRSRIRRRDHELINERAKAFEEAVNASMITGAVSANLEGFDAAFKDFFEWENSTVLDFQRSFER